MRAYRAFVEYSHFGSDVSNFANNTSATGILPQWLKEYPDGETVMTGAHRYGYMFIDELSLQRNMYIVVHYTATIPEAKTQVFR